MKVELGEQYFRADFLLISGCELTLNLLSRKTKQNKTNSSFFANWIQNTSDCG